MVHEILPVGVLQCNCSVFGDETTREAIVIDPGDDLHDILEVINRHSFRVKAIFITHAHIDHVQGAQRLRALTQAPVYLNRNDADLLRTLDLQAAWIGAPSVEMPEIDSDASDGLAVPLGSAVFHVMHTPGHTQGSCCLWVPEESKLIAGDTLFRDSIGRTDLPGGDGRQLLSSIRTQLLPLPEHTIVIPGHGPQTTIGRERAFNPFLQRL